ncbi:MAG: YicC family protein [Neisseriaceae bacterium]|nr:MAG: YicC family protein [Neisseriaceae bacterium]
MIYSMTGYASKVVLINNQNFQLELKSVNHRFLDLTIKTHEELKPLEQKIRQLLGEHIQRGKLDFKCFIKDNNDESKKFTLNQHVVTQYLEMLKQIQAITLNDSNISAKELLTLPGVIAQEQSTLENIDNQLLEDIAELVKEYKLTLSAEGVKLQEIIIERLTQMSSIVAEAAPLIQEAIKGYQDKLKTKLLTALSDAELAEARIQQEIAVFCQKIDVTEEMDRLTAHIKEFNKLLKNGGAIGKRLDFICQEMNREANTFGSKSVSIKTTQKAVDLKVLIEQIREQVQNIM